MTEHYFSNTPSASSNEETFSFELRGQTFRFTSDRGVFSKKEVDFGSRVLIDSFEVNNVKGPILDVGCGYGPIGLTIAKLRPDEQVHMVDVNERALALSEKNAKANGINNVQIYQSSCYSNVKINDFSTILTNPPIRAGKKIVHEILEGAYNHLVEQGELWVVIQKKQGAPSALAKLESLFEEVEVVEKKKGYYIIRAKKC
ncbi:16S rRNA methyltransferase [Priestia aryabhattai]|uniref:class I SAM-dependent methyltransferase n=1 Tax=Priestia TaxID=2800373 RepID=UPI000BA13162|nr:class I SAM-dependent methyltransferase [Priestia flexa]MDT2048690.1 class I SAM-dependent methyltransferase [Priestia flexa]OZT10975.1 16S rRNA methyltransferase [Priestia aryabhattai]USY55264.1 class I SAM-dependent methyltransferase [Bacillus sp. 1780r2a1]